MPLRSITSSLNQTCTVYGHASQNKVGQTSFGAGTDLRCRFQKTNQTIVTAQSEKEPVDGIVFLDHNASVTLEDKMVFGSDSYRVLRIEPMVDGRGRTRHYELMVQRWNI